MPFLRGEGFAPHVVLRRLLALAVALPSCAFAQVQIDGTTATTVVINPSGSVTVGVAPSTSDGISLNKYTQFNVPQPGLELDNRVEAARTIVNEVTGTSRTDINGPVEVLGQRAHVIVANPNGIVIDGGRFVNTGRVALTTGQISTTSQQIAPGIFQDNVVSTVTGGVISVEGAGLAGQMDSIDLIAHTIRVNGPVTNESTNADAGLRLFAGASRTEFSSAVLPGNTSLSWGNVTGTGATSEGAVLVTLTRPGVLRANALTIEVNDRGAGVRYAGEGYATSRGFSLRADGTIDLSDARIEGVGGIAVTGRAVTLDNSALSSSGGAAVIEASDTAGTGISGTDFNLTALGIDLRSQSDLSFGATTAEATKLRATTGSIAATVTGTFTDTNALFEAANGLQLNATGGFRFTGSTLTAQAGSITLDSTGSFVGSGLVANAFGNMFVTAESAELQDSPRRTTLTAQNGSFILTTLGATSRGDLRNAGGAIQGGVQVAGAVDSAGTTSDGAVTLNIKGRLINTTTDELAVIFGAGGDVSIRTGADIENARGRILANGDVRLLALGDVLNMVSAPGGAVDPTVTEVTRKGRRQWWTLWIKRKREAFVSYDYGTLANPDRLSTITASGGITIDATAGRVINQGGTINANGGDLEIKALRVETVGLGSGRVSVRRTCVLTCSYDGGGAIAFYGGQLNASANMSIEATDTFRNKGGAVFAVQDVTITTPNAELEAALVPAIVNRPSGLYNFWSSKSAWAYLRDQFGTIVAETGKVRVNSARPLRILGGKLEAGDSLDIAGGQSIVRAPGARGAPPNRKIGFFSGQELIRR